MSWDTWKKRQFHIRFQKADEGGYIVSIPEMPGCVTQAETFEEGLAMIKDALEGLLEVAVEDGDPVPEQFMGLVGEFAGSSAAHGTGQLASGLTAEHQASLALLQEAIAHLGERERTIIQLRYAESRPFHEIAQIMGLSQSQVVMLHHRILSSLRRHLQRLERVEGGREATRSQAG